MKRILSVLVIACALLLASCGGSTDTNTNDSTVSAATSVDASDAVSSEAETSEVSESGDTVAYDEIFSSRNLIVLPEIFVGLDAVEFAFVYEDSIIELEQLTYGCDEDTIVEWVSTIYAPTEGLTDDEIDYVDTQLRTVYDEYDALDCCEVTYSNAGSYMTVRIHFTELDNSENISELATLGLVDGAADYLSLSKSESGLIAAGFVKKG